VCEALSALSAQSKLSLDVADDGFALGVPPEGLENSPVNLQLHLPPQRLWSLPPQVSQNPVHFLFILELILLLSLGDSILGTFGVLEELIIYLRIDPVVIQWDAD